MERGTARNIANQALSMAYILEHSERLVALVDSLKIQLLGEKIALHTSNNQLWDTPQKLTKVEEKLAAFEREKAKLRADLDKTIRAKVNAERELKVVGLVRKRMEKEAEVALTKAKEEAAEATKAATVEEFKSSTEYEKLLDDWTASSEKWLIEGLYKALIACRFLEAIEIALQMLPFAKGAAAEEGASVEGTEKIIQVPSE